jgi:hypothetical protein
MCHCAAQPNFRSLDMGSLWVLIQQLQLYVLAGTRILGDHYHLSPQLLFVYNTLLQIIEINLITKFRHPPFTVMSIHVELSSPSYFELAVPKDPRWSSPPDAKVEVADSINSVKKPARLTKQCMHDRIIMQHANQASYPGT